MISQNGLFPRSKVEKIKYLKPPSHLIQFNGRFLGLPGRTTVSPKSSSDSMTFERKDDHGRVFEGHPKKNIVWIP